MIKLFIGLACLLTVAADTVSDRCNLCLDIATRAKKVGTDDEATTRSKATFAAYEYFGTQRETYYDELNCHWDKYYADANTPLLEGTTPLTTCADTGFCPLSNQLNQYVMVDLTNTTHNYYSYCTIPNMIVLHHTVDPTIDATLNAFHTRQASSNYIVAKNGTIYLFVNEYHAAWHAGGGIWREYQIMNANSIGIEIVNNGQEPFNDVQMASVKMLVDTLKKRWHVRDDYIVAHAEIIPNQKDDVSGYFDWKDFNDYIKIQKDEYATQLSTTQMGQVLFDSNSVDKNGITNLQNRLYSWGYRKLISTPGLYDNNTMYNVEAFNRRYVPELFIKETNDGKVIYRDDRNKRWYALSEERLSKLYATLPSEN